jgi:hypothetical protein
MIITIADERRRRKRGCRGRWGASPPGLVSLDSSAGAWSSRVSRPGEQERIRHQKPPCRSSHSGGGSAPAPPGNPPTRRASEPGGVPIAARLMAWATATRIVPPESPKASHLRRLAIYGAQAPSGQAKVTEPLSGFPSAGARWGDLVVAAAPSGVGWQSPRPAGDPHR